MKVRLKTIRWEAEGIHAFCFEPLSGKKLPSFEAGAHVDVSLQDGLTRSYSLLNDPADPSFYEFAVHLSPDSRGGSRYIHDNWRVGQIVEVSDPKNNFPLEENANHSILIAGGIGITPLLSMLARLDLLGQAVELYYVAHSSERAAFVDLVKDRDNVTILFDGGEGAQHLDLEGIVKRAPEDAHLYCCGPTGMLEAFQKFSEGRAKSHIHVEYFTADTKIADEGGFVVELSRSEKSIAVEPGETILDALLNANVNVSFACSEGTCGTCETRVLDGIPDHRDFFLTDEEKETNTSMMVCCSGSKTSRLILDL